MPSDALLKLIAAKRANPYTPSKTVEELRAEGAAAAADATLPEGTQILAVDAGGTPAEWVSTPNAANAGIENGVFMFIHGGGYYRGSPMASRSISAWLSQETGLKVLSVGYRLAPESPYPAAVDDIFGAWNWLLAQGCAAEKTVVGGVSAGGGLTLALLLRARDEGVSLPALAVPMSPWTDMTMSGASFDSRADVDPSISRVYLQIASEKYLAGTEPTTAYASPLHADLTGLPPLFIQVGDAETLLDDSVQLAEKAKQAAVDVTLDIWPELIHGWQMNPHLLPEAQDALRKIGQFCISRLT